MRLSTLLCTSLFCLAAAACDTKHQAGGQSNVAAYAGSSAGMAGSARPGSSQDLYGSAYSAAQLATFEDVEAGTVQIVDYAPVSTFSADVDTASYAWVRRILNSGHLPQANQVRPEELINYFPYDYPAPADAKTPFKPTVAIYPTPWNAQTRLMHIGIKGYVGEQSTDTPPNNLVLVIDISGSMNAKDKLPLLKKSLHLLLDELNDDDTVGIVTYAGSAEVALEPTTISQKAKIIEVIDALKTAGRTAGGAGMDTAYELAERNFDKNGVNRVLLATDGDFNVGKTTSRQLKTLIEEKRETGIYLSVLGFGSQNYNDRTAQVLAQNGNGNAYYINNLTEARKVMQDEATAMLFPIADDVKFQVEFNPTQVAEYRLLGYETRALKREDFNNDKVDAGDIGNGHSVTAIYEITPASSKTRYADKLRYAKQTTAETNAAFDTEYAFLKMRYKLPGASQSTLITRPITLKDEVSDIAILSDDMRFAASVAGFAQLLRDQKYTADYSYDDVLALATHARGTDPYNYRGEFITLVRNAKSLAPKP